MLKKHNFLNLIPKDWWDAWCNYVGFYDEQCGEEPGILRNTDFVDGETYKEN